jgi:hypothetical protein
MAEIADPVNYPFLLIGPNIRVLEEKAWKISIKI